MAGETRTETYSLRERLERSGFTEAWLVRLDRSGLARLVRLDEEGAQPPP